MRKQLQALHLDFSVIDAVDGSSLTREETDLYSKERAAQYSHRELRPGEIGCAISHARMWERMVREGLKELLILEDDVIIGKALPDILGHRNKFPKDWEFINFSTDAPQEPFGGFLTDIYRASRHKAWADRSSAYLINLRGAKKLLDHVYPIGHTADGITWRTDITGLVSYGVYPRAVILSGLDSTIWAREALRQPGLAARKWNEFLIMMKTISRFFGVTPLIKRITGRIRSLRRS